MGLSPGRSTCFQHSAVCHFIFLIRYILRIELLRFNLIPKGVVINIVLKELCEFTSYCRFTTTSSYHKIKPRPWTKCPLLWNVWESWLFQALSLLWSNLNTNELVRRRDKARDASFLTILLLVLWNLDLYTKLTFDNWDRTHIEKTHLRFKSRN